MAWPIFPHCPSFGFTKRADYSVTIVERGGGIRTVNRNWYYPLHSFSAVPFDNRRDDDMSLIQRFWHAVGGQSGQFLFKDYTDYKSTDEPSAAITPIDQPLVATEDDGVYQMMKVYRDEEFLFEQQRIIQKPRTNTIRIADDGVELTAGVDYAVDYDEGLVTFTSSLSGVLTWGGEFYVPVMFESTPEFMITNWRNLQTGFALRELRLSAPTLVQSS